MLFFWIEALAAPGLLAHSFAQATRLRCIEIFVFALAVAVGAHKPGSLGLALGLQSPTYSYGQA